MFVPPGHGAGLSVCYRYQRTALGASEWIGQRPQSALPGASPRRRAGALHTRLRLVPRRRTEAAPDAGASRPPGKPAAVTPRLPRRERRKETPDEEDEEDSGLFETRADGTRRFIGYDQFERDDSETADVADAEEQNDTVTPRAPRKVQRPTRFPIIAVLGRPNVGKSTIVNRMAGEFKTGAVVEDVPGVTRDRTYRLCEHNGRFFQVVDTGGLLFDDDPQNVFLPQIREQALVAMREASGVVLVVDGQEGVHPVDVEVASFLRRECLDATDRSSPPPRVVVAVNKCESVRFGDAQAAEFWRLGLGEPIPVSGIHGGGVAEVLDRLCEEIPEPQPRRMDENGRWILDEPPDDLKAGILNVAIIGRPNVGKSSLLNRFLGSERAIVSEVPGTTRDAVDELLVVTDPRTGDEYGYRLIDTAGIRRKKSISYGTEFFMINRAFKAIRRADVVLLVLDMTQGVYEQDATLAERIADDGRACIIVGNKWDAVEGKDDRAYRAALRKVRERLPMLSWADALLVSAMSGQRVPRILDLVNAAAEQHGRRVRTAVLNEVLMEAIRWQPPPSTRQGKNGKVYYATQVSTRPPTFALFVNDPKLFSGTYRRFIERRFREGLGFRGTPLRFLWRGRRIR